MITDERVRAISLFFFLAFMNEKVALQASEKTIARLKVKKKPAVDDVVLIRLLRGGYEQYREPASRHRARPSPDHMTWIEGGRVGLEPWIKFQQDAGENEIVAVVLSRVLGFSDEAIASGLGISLGTIRHRIGKGMRHLGVHAKNAGG